MPLDTSDFVPDKLDTSDFVPDTGAPAVAAAQPIDPRAYLYGHTGTAPLPAPSAAMQKQIAQQVLRSQPISQIFRDEAQATLGAGSRLGLQVGGAVAGQAIGAESGIPGGQFVGGAIGAMGGNVANQALGNQPFSMGQVAEAGMMGGVPIGPAGKTAAEIAVQAGKYAALGGAGKASQIAIDQGADALASIDALKKVGTAATVSALAAPIGSALDKGAGAAAQAIAKGNNSEMDASIAAANAAGFKVLPADTNPNLVNKTLQSVGGKVAGGQYAKIYNQQIADDMVRAQLGIKPGTALTPDSIQAARDVAAQPYQQVAALSPNAASAVDGWKDANKLAIQWQKYHDVNWVNLTPTAAAEAKKNAETFAQAADSYERDMVTEATKAGKPELIPAINDARVKIAQTYVADKALWQGTGHIDPTVFGNIYQKNPDLLTGNFETLGRSANALGKVIQGTEKVSQPGGTAQGLWESALGAGEGYRLAGAKGAVVGGALPLAHPAARGIAFSAPWQKYMGLPTYAAPQADLLARFGAQGALQAPSASLLQSYAQPPQQP